LLWCESQGQGAFGHVGLLANLLMLGAGVVTAVPLLLFGVAARRVSLSAVGILQYVAPTLQFLLGVWAYHEPFTRTHLIGYSLVWLALLVFWAEGWWQIRRAGGR
jgi:chloramphenicol-sensitive protein RarD